MSCPSTAPYSGTVTVNGRTITICSNYPVNQNLPTPSLVVVDVNFTAPVAGLDINQVKNAVVQEFQSRGYTVNVLSVTVTNNAYTLEFLLEVSSPPPVVIAAIIAVAVAAIIVAITIYQIVITLKTTAPGTIPQAVTSFSVFLIGLGIAAAAFGVGYLINSLRKKS
jgi:hypothetical protein